jgi:superfamily II DNA or RNA helicase
LKRRLSDGTADVPDEWLAFDTRLDAEVIVRRYPVDMADGYEREIALFGSGAPHVPGLIDAYDDFVDRRKCLVCASIKGTRLDKLGRLPMIDAIRVCARLAWLFQSMHSAKPVRFGLGDVSAEDFVRDNNDTLWIVRGDKSGRLEEIGIGEEVRSAGRVALQVLCGGPLSGDLGSDLSIVPDWLAEVIERAVDDEAQNRYSSAQWFAQALEDVAIRHASDRTDSASDLPSQFKPIFRPVRLAESPVAHALEHLDQAPSLGMARLAHAALSFEDMDDGSGLTALDTLEVDRYPHQIQAAAAVVHGAGMDAGAILADEVGLGKTIEALMICQELRARAAAESVLIVASPSGAPQWLAETGLRVRRNAYEPGFRLYQSSRDAGYPLLIVSSATLRQERRLAQLLDRRYDLVIVDEAHQCCAGAGKLSTLGRAISRLDRRRLLLLTATPLGNRLWDLFTLADLIRPGVLGTPKQFAREFIDRSALGSEFAEAAVRSLRARMQALMVRHRRADLAGIVVPRLDCRIVDATARGAGKVSKAAELMAGPWKDERVVVFSRSAAHRAALARAIEKQDPSRVVIVFQSGRRQSRAQERQFNDYAASVIISGDTVSEGMNWQRARCELHMDVALSPIVWEQRVGRVFRLGQHSPSLEIVHLAEPGSAEARIYELYVGALGLFTLAVGEASIVLDHLADSDLRNLETPIRAILRKGDADASVLAELKFALASAREQYDRKSGEAAALDEIYFGGGLD